MKTACLILAIGEKYKKLAQPAINSFKKFHPDVDLYFITDDNANDYESFNLIKDVGYGMAKYCYALEIMTTKSYDKMICLGSDTITCARLDEFLDNNTDDIICTLDYKIQFNYLDGISGEWNPPKDYKGEYKFPKHKYSIFSPLVLWNAETNAIGMKWENTAIKPKQELDVYWAKIKKDLGCIPCDHMYLNADVICFNNTSPLKDMFRFYKNIRESDDSKARTYIGYYGEQGLLNLFVWGQRFINVEPENQASIIKILKDSVEQRRYKTVFPEAPYAFSSVSYNVRSKCKIDGLHPADTKNRDQFWTESTKNFYVKDNKLFCKSDFVDKQIKVWHYCEGLSILDDNEFVNTVNKWNLEYFNDDTRKFFSEQCNAGDFFEKEFAI